MRCSAFWALPSSLRCRCDQLRVTLLLVVMPNFAARVEVAVDALSSSPQKEVDENEFIDGSRLVYDGVREIRRAVLMNRVSGHHLCCTGSPWLT